MTLAATVKLPYHFAAQYGVCLLGGAAVPTLLFKAGMTPEILAEVSRIAGPGLRLEQVTLDQFDDAMQVTYQHADGAAQKFAEDVGEAMSLTRAVDSVVENSDLLAQEDDAPVIRLINALLMEALRENASDIHVETFEKSLIVRLRIDGVLHETVKLEPGLAPLLVSRIKVMAKLDIAEKRLPQDGRMSLRIGGREVDVRVSTMPAGAGERVVLRLLDKQGQRLDVTQLGLSDEAMATLQRLIAKPHGIILITGPTGSGKTTSLYAMLSQMNDRRRNILTIEDPVEYQIEGIGQTQVNARVDLTFARGLRAILRQDPDVVMVGEIRDGETASIAVQASLTGHLVVSTLHTNSAIGAITRLIDMGVEPFLLSSSLVGLMAQRLVRALCHHCKAPYRASTTECAFLGVSPHQPPEVYRAVGCTHCRGSGYKGRLGIYELVMVDEAMRALMHERASEEALEAHARRHSASIREDGRMKVLAGITTSEEVMRVTSE